METIKIKPIIVLLSILAISFSFIGGDCGTDSDPTPPGGSSIAAVTNVNLRVDANPGGSSLAVVSWTKSADSSRSDFAGYVVKTYVVDSTGTIISQFGSTQNVPEGSNSQIVNSIQLGTLYRSFIWARLDDGSTSDSVGTQIYSGVFYNNDGSIDTYRTSGPAASGFGWDILFGGGLGLQLSFVPSNASQIDLHLRGESINNLMFHSPDGFLTGASTTKFSLIGQGQAAFDQTNLTEPTQDSIAVAVNNVYLLKTETNHYVKVWVKDITDVIVVPPYTNVKFDYKVQTVAGLRIVKR